MKKRTVCCVFCGRFKQKKQWTNEKYDLALKKIKKNKIKIIFAVCKDCQRFDAVFALRNFKKNRK